MDSRTEQRVRMIDGGIREVLEVESDGIVWDKSARVKIPFDVTKPLHRIRQVRAKDGNVVMVEVKYERLPSFAMHVQCWDI